MRCLFPATFGVGLVVRLGVIGRVDAPAHVPVVPRHRLEVAFGLDDRDYLIALRDHLDKLTRPNTG